MTEASLPWVPGPVTHHIIPTCELLKVYPIYVAVKKLHNWYLEGKIIYQRYAYTNIYLLSKYMKQII